MPLALLCLFLCVNVASLYGWLFLSGPLLGVSVFSYGCIYVSGLIPAFVFYLCVLYCFQQLLGSLGFLIVPCFKHVCAGGGG